MIFSSLEFLILGIHAGKMQHSLWVVEVTNSSLVDAPSNIPDLSSSRLPPKNFSFHRIWQAKGAHSAASKVEIFFSLLLYLFQAICECEGPSWAQWFSFCIKGLNRKCRVGNPILWKSFGLMLSTLGHKQLREHI